MLCLYTVATRTKYPAASHLRQYVLPDGIAQKPGDAGPFGLWLNVVEIKGYGFFCVPASETAVF